MINIYVGNLSYRMTEDELRDAFAAFGTVERVKIVSDRYTGQSRGFGFVEMAGRDEGEQAINELNGREVKGRSLKVNEAKPRN